MKIRPQRHPPRCPHSRGRSMHALQNYAGWSLFFGAALGALIAFSIVPIDYSSHILLVVAWPSVAAIVAGCSGGRAVAIAAGTVASAALGMTLTSGGLDWIIAIPGLLAGLIASSGATSRGRERTCWLVALLLSGLFLLGWSLHAGPARPTGDG